MLSLEQVKELTSANNIFACTPALADYFAGLEEVNKGNFTALVDMRSAEQLAALAKEAEAVGNDSAAIFTLFALIASKTRVLFAAENDPRRTTLEELNAAVEQRSAELNPPYELPVLSLAGTDGYTVAAQMQKGAILKLTQVGGWCVLGKRPGENVYPTDAAVADLIARHLIVPAIGQPWDGTAKEYLLSAIGWRALGCLYTDHTAAVERRVYEVIGTDRDNNSARRFRTVTADWRARQARKDISPGWNRWSEFPITIPEKITGDGVKTVVCLFESGRPNNPDVFEFFGDAILTGHHQYTQGQGATLNGTVFDRAYKLAADLCRIHAEIKREIKREIKLAAKAVKPPKAAKPAPLPLTIMDAGEDADDLAAALGLL